MKKAMLSVLAAVFLLSVGLCVGCGPKEEEPVFVEPELRNLTVDVSDRPEGVFLGDALLSEVSLDGRKLEQNEYLIRERYFLFTFAYYGEIGKGAHTAAFSFSNHDAVNLTITVDDALPPDYDLPTVRYYEYSAKQTVTFPEIVRNRPYQNYSVNYALKKGEQTVFEAGDGKENERPTSAEGFETGEYVYVVRVEQNETVLEEQTYPVFVGCGENLFSAENFANNWQLQSTAYMNVAFDDATNAIRVDKDGDVGCEERLFTSANRRLYADASALKAAFESGYNQWYFSYYSELTGDVCGFRLYRRVGHAAGDCGAELCTVSNENLVKGAWTTVSVDLNMLFRGENADATEISITVVGENGTSIRFRHGYFDRIEYDKTDLFNENLVPFWTAQAPGNLNYEYDAGEGAAKVMRLTDNTSTAEQFTSVNNRIYFRDLDALKETYEAGNRYLAFDYYSTLGTGATGAYYGFRIASNTEITNNLGSEIVTFTGGTLAENAWQTAIIDLEKVFGSGREAAELSFVVCGGAGSSLMLKNVRYLDEIPYESVFDANSVSYRWEGVTNCQITKSFDLAENAMKLTANNANVTSGDRHHAIVIDKAVFEAALAEGYNAFTFQIKGDANFVADATAGFALYSHTNVSASDNRNNEAGLFVKTYAYGKVRGTQLSNSEYRTVNVDLVALLSRSGMTGVGIWLGGSAGSSVYVKGGTFTNMFLSDIFTEGNAPSWKVTNGSVTTRSWDETEDAFKFAVTSAGATGGARYFCTYLARTKLEQALEQGYKTFSFDLKANDTFMNSATSDIRIYSHKTDGAAEGTAISGVFVYRTLGTADVSASAYTTITVDLEAFLNLRQGDFGIGFCLDGDNGSCIYLRNERFEKENDA